MATYDFDGDKYKAASKHQKEWGSAIIVELPLAGNERILDLGCGDGALTAQLARRVPAGSLIGIDASAGMIETAKKLTQDNLDFRLMDINHLNVENHFDLVFSNATLQWIKDHNRLLRSVRESLKPGGMIRFNFAGDGNCSNLLAVVQEAMRHDDHARYFENFQWPWYMPAVCEYRELVVRCGFRQVKVWGENADRYFGSAEEMIRWIDQPSLVPFLKYVADDDRQRFRDTVVEKMMRRTQQADGRCFETFRRINVFARK